MAISIRVTISRVVFTKQDLCACFSGIEGVNNVCTYHKLCTNFSTLPPQDGTLSIQWVSIIVFPWSFHCANGIPHLI